MRNVWLAHHGILGQRWGVRRFQDKRGRLTTAGKKRYSDKNHKSEEQGEKEKFWTDERKAMVKKIAIGTAVVAGVALASYGTYKLGQSGKLEDLTILGRQKVTRLLNQNKGEGNLLGNIEELSKDTGFKVRETPISILNSTKIVNPGYETGELKYTRNCFSATTADIMNRMNDGHGLMVQAREATENEIKNGGLSFNSVAKVWKNSSIDDIILDKNSLKSVDLVKTELTDKIKNYCKSENGIGMLRIKGSKNSAVGHYLKFEIKNGDVFLSDSQSGTMTKVDRYLKGMMDGKVSRGIEILNCDGLEIDSNVLKEMVKSL